MKIKILLGIVFVSLFLSCNNKIKLVENQIIEGSESHIIKPTYSNLFDISPLLDTVRYVRLELTDQSIIGSIDKVIVFENQIYILDRQTASLMVYDSEGKFLFKILKIGQGPGEYVQLDFFDIDREKKQIVLTDLMNYWIMRYDLEGNYISRQKIPYWSEGVAPIHNKGIALYANFRNNKEQLEDEYNLLYLDSLMRVEKAFFSYNSSNFENPLVRFSIPQGGSFYYYNNDFYFFSSIESVVYQVAPQGLISKYRFDFGKDNFDLSYLDNPNKLKGYVDKKPYASLCNVNESDHLLFFYISESSVPILNRGYYSKDSGNTLCSPMFTIGKEEPFDGNDIATYDSWIIAEIKVDELIDWKESVDKRKKTFQNPILKEKKALADKLTLDDNSVLMFYKLKPF